VIFDPHDPGPARPAPPRAPAERITRAPWQMPARATCHRHQVYVDGCGRCDEAITERSVIREREHARHARSLMAAPAGR